MLCSPPDAVTLRFGDNSFFPHLAAARLRGIEPTVIRLPGIAMDVDHPVDLAALLRLPQSARTRTRAFLEAAGVPRLLADRGIFCPEAAALRLRGGVMTTGASAAAPYSGGSARFGDRPVEHVALLRAAPTGAAPRTAAPRRGRT